MSQSTTRARRLGRSLELLLMRIKQHQSPNASVRSPDFIADVDTGGLCEKRLADGRAHVGSAMVMAKKMDKQMQMALKSMFPGQSFLQIRFAQKPLQAA